MSTVRPIKLYDFRSSPNCQRVKVVMEEKNFHTKQSLLP